MFSVSGSRLPLSRLLFFVSLLHCLLLLHSHEHPFRRSLLVQLCRHHNQLLQLRPPHVSYAPQLYVPHALPGSSSSFPGSASAVPRRKMQLTWSLATMNPHSGPFESYEGIFHGFTYSSEPATDFFTNARTAFATPASFPAFFTYASIQTLPSFPSIVGTMPSSQAAAILRHRLERPRILRLPRPHFLTIG